MRRCRRTPSLHRTSGAGHIGIEFGPAWFSRNDARIPGTTGTEFDMTDVTGSGPDAYFRIEGDWDINDKHGLRFVLAPLEVSGAGTLAQDTDFAGTTFAAGPTEERTSLVPTDSPTDKLFTTVMHGSGGLASRD